MFCVLAQEQKESLPGQRDHFLLAPAVATSWHELKQCIYIILTDFVPSLSSKATFSPSLSHREVAEHCSELSELDSNPVFVTSLMTLGKLLNLTCKMAAVMPTLPACLIQL